MKSPMITSADYIPDEEKARYTDMQVLKSAAGYYVGTWYIDAEMGETPGSRDSFGYFKTHGEAEKHRADIIEGRAQTRQEPGDFGGMIIIDTRSERQRQREAAREKLVERKAGNPEARAQARQKLEQQLNKGAPDRITGTKRTRTRDPGIER